MKREEARRRGARDLLFLFFVFLLLFLVLTDQSRDKRLFGKSTLSCFPPLL